jgi:hypothetical protein
VIEDLPSRCEILHSTLSTAKTKQKQIEKNFKTVKEMKYSGRFHLLLCDACIRSQGSRILDRMF